MAKPGSDRRRLEVEMERLLKLLLLALLLLLMERPATVWRIVGWQRKAKVNFFLRTNLD